MNLLVELLMAWHSYVRNEYIFIDKVVHPPNAVKCQFF